MLKKIIKDRGNKDRQAKVGRCQPEVEGTGERPMNYYNMERRALKEGKRGSTEGRGHETKASILPLLL
jgi:hypothetical protein